MPRCELCSKFANFAEVPPAPQLDRNWSSRAEMIASAHAGCDLCTLCWQYAAWVTLDEYLDEPMRLYRCYDKHSPETGPIEIQQLRAGEVNYIRICDFESPANQIPPLIDEAAIPQAQRLLAKCLSSHGDCSRIYYGDLGRSGEGTCEDATVRSNIRQSLPRRLLDLSRVPNVLVVDVEDWIIDGTTSLAELSQYCILSYRWGVTAHSCILRAPFARQISVDMESMPQPFRDGKYITRGLGIRFLWIDALCIVQPGACSDDMDWNTEGPRMGTTYHKAICTIAATCADSAEDGLLSKMDSERICAAPCAVIQHSSSGKIRVRMLKPVGVRFRQAVTCSALNKRGWVTQERRLSRRILHFTLQGVIWECRSTIEHGHTNVSEVDAHGSGHIWSSSISKNPQQDNWMHFVADYSTTKFTDTEDRLVALSSLARLVHRKLDGHDVYCAGLWRSSLLKDLLWYKYDSPSVETPYRVNVAPTWSWASLHGRVWIGGWFSTKDVLVQVLDVHLTLAQRSSPYGNIQSGWIKLYAQVVTIFIETENVREIELPPLDSEYEGSKWYKRTV